MNCTTNLEERQRRKEGNTKQQNLSSVNEQHFFCFQLPRSHIHLSNYPGKKTENIIDIIVVAFRVEFRVFRLVYFLDDPNCHVVGNKKKGPRFAGFNLKLKFSARMHSLSYMRRIRLYLRILPRRR